MGHKKGRRLLLAAGGLLVIRRIGFAQQSSKVWRVGWLQTGRQVPYLDEFSKGLRELGYEEGKNLVIEWRFAEGHFDRLPALAAELVSRKVDVLVASGTHAAEALRRATSTIPVVMAIVGDPVGSGFVASLAHPGGNITGLSLANAEIATKWLELARSVAPSDRIGILADLNQKTAPRYVSSIQSAAQRIGVKVPVAYAPTANHIASAIASLAQERVRSIIILPSGMLETEAKQIAQLTLTHRMASVGSTRVYVEAGALLGYGQNYAAFARRAAAYVDKILKGAKPSELPVEQPVILELVINMKTARQLGQTIPKELLLRADKVIE